MRGLTPDERFILKRMTDNSLEHRDVTNEPANLHAARASLTKDGRTWQAWVVNDKNERVFRTDITSKGREALRCDLAANVGLVLA